MQIGIVGAGLMGHGIALNFAINGHTVTVFDPVAEARNQLKQRITQSLTEMGKTQAEITTALAKVTTTETIAEVCHEAELIIEAAPEQLELKQDLFVQLEQHAPPTCILASNTSVMPITQIMAKITTKHRAIGTHWWNPPHLIPLVEVIATQESTPEVIDKTIDILTRIGKTAIKVAKDIPGFIGNRLQHALWREAISLVEKGICSAEDIDNVVKQSFGRRLDVLGPLENADLVGTDLTLAIHQQVLADLATNANPSPYLEQLVSKGKLGVKTNEGFRKWHADEPKQVRQRVTNKLLEFAKDS